jgi:AcrR family transcriptional regulator
MARKPLTRTRREDSLSRERIIEASIELLDASGEAGLTFRALSERLATGPGAIYGHIANKSDLVTAACDAVIARTLVEPVSSADPEAVVRSLALGLFDVIDAHPWVGAALTFAPGHLPAVRILERLGQQVAALGVPAAERWATVSALLSYILGVGGQNSANSNYAQKHALVRSDFLDSVAVTWSRLDAVDFPFTRSMAGPLREHDDRVDFLAGVDLILRGIGASRSRS